MHSNYGVLGFGSISASSQILPDAAKSEPYFEHTIGRVHQLSHAISDAVVKARDIADRLYGPVPVNEAQNERECHDTAISRLNYAIDTAFGDLAALQVQLTRLSNL